MARRVLIITYLFPPSGGVGPPRYAGYARHLPAHGFEVSVIAPRNPNTPLYDPDLLQQVPAQTRVHRVFNPGVPYFLRDRLWSGISGSAARLALPPNMPISNDPREILVRSHMFSAWRVLSALERGLTITTQVIPASLRPRVR